MKIAILGYGGRGKNYAQILQRKYKKQAQIVAVIETNEQKLNIAKKSHNLPDETCFSSYDDFLKKDVLADWLFVCTQDSDHFAQTVAGIKKGYNILLEKPISKDIGECETIAAYAKKFNRKVAVCHVLRYTAFYSKVKDIVDSKILGKLISVEMVENVGYWHQAHSFVRGDWGKSLESSPMIFAKCCHDLDLMAYFVQSPCSNVVSIGKLNHFKHSEAPDSHAQFCSECKLTDCPYDAKKIYIDTLKKIPAAKRKYAWPQSRVVPDGEPTMEKVENALKKGQFGKCVYECDNDVVDYQSSLFEFENGVQGSLIMTAFSDEIYRTITLRGTLGTLEGKFEDNILYLKIFGKKTKKISVHNAMKGGHGGGDIGLMDGIVNNNLLTDIDLSIQSHKMAYACEASRLDNGAPHKV